MLRAVSFLCMLLGCSGETPNDQDFVRDALAEIGERADSATDDTGVADSGAADSGPKDSAAMDTAREDTRPVCAMEDGEPNNSLPSATPLKEIDDCDGSGGSFKGVLSGQTDPDFFHYKGNDKVGCVVDATASTKSSVRLCVFVACAAGTTDLKSCKKGMRETSPGGVLGCCSDGPGEVVVEHTCPLVGTSDSADVYMRVDAPGSGSACTEYDVAYHF